MICDPTIDELLSEPIIRKLMARDGVHAEEVRSLLSEAQARTRPEARAGAILLPMRPTILTEALG